MFKRHVRLIGFFALFACLFMIGADALAVKSAPRQGKDGLAEFYLETWGGDARRYYVHAPQRYNPMKSYPVVLNLHGGGGNAVGAAEGTDFNAFADKKGFIAVYPEGTGQKILGKLLATWNGGRCCGKAAEKNIDDVSFIRQVLDDLKRRYNIDRKRVYVTGISNGAIMAHRLACDLSNQITAIAPVAGPGIIENCKPERAVPVMIIHGTDDQCALYKGGQKCGGCWQRAISQATGLPDRGRGRFACMSVSDQAMTWQKINGCKGGWDKTYENGAAQCFTAQGCGMEPVVTCKIHGGGHTWPGAPGPKCDRDTRFCKAYIDVVGAISQDLDANEMMWDFFRKYSL